MTNTNQNGRVRDEQIKNIVKDVAENKSDIGVIARELVKVQVELAELRERSKTYQVAQGVLTILATTIAAYIASKM